MTFVALETRLVAAMRLKIRNGEVTERAFARRVGVSQPHIHQVMKGVKTLSAAMSDRVLEGLGLTVHDLTDIEAWPESLTAPPPGWPLRDTSPAPAPPSSAS